MTRFARPCVALLSLIATAAMAAAPSASPHGRYVEARTASVFAGACHYNGERVTEGRSAVMAWQIDGGTFQGTDLAGVRVMAAVAAESNLAEDTARRGEIVVDAPTDAAVAAAAAWVKTQTAARLGDTPAVRRGSVSITDSDGRTTAASPGFASITMRPMPDAACCSQPQLVWYTPLAPLTDRRVGYTETASFAGSRIGDAWTRNDENSAIYGHFGATPANAGDAVASAEKMPAIAVAAK